MIIFTYSPLLSLPIDSLLSSPYFFSFTSSAFKIFIISPNFGNVSSTYETYTELRYIVDDNLPSIRIHRYRIPILDLIEDAWVLYLDQRNVLQNTA